MNDRYLKWQIKLLLLTCIILYKINQRQLLLHQTHCLTTDLSYSENTSRVFTLTKPTSMNSPNFPCHRQFREIKNGFFCSWFINKQVYNFVDITSEGSFQMWVEIISVSFVMEKPTNDYTIMYQAKKVKFPSNQAYNEYKVPCRENQRLT